MHLWFAYKILFLLNLRSWFNVIFMIQINSAFSLYIHFCSAIEETSRLKGELRLPVW